VDTVHILLEPDARSKQLFVELAFVHTVREIGILPRVYKNHEQTLYAYKGLPDHHHPLLPLQAHGIAAKIALEAKR
jgi:hypothetical protein